MRTLDLDSELGERLLSMDSASARSKCTPMTWTVGSGSMSMLSLLARSSRMESGWL